MKRRPIKTVWKITHSQSIRFVRQNIYAVFTIEYIGSNDYCNTDTETYSHICEIHSYGEKTFWLQINRVTFRKQQQVNKASDITGQQQMLYRHLEFSFHFQKIKKKPHTQEKKKRRLVVKLAIIASFIRERANICIEQIYMTFIIFITLCVCRSQCLCLSLSPCVRSLRLGFFCSVVVCTRRYSY